MVRHRSHSATWRSALTRETGTDVHNMISNPVCWMNSERYRDSGGNCWHTAQDASPTVGAWGDRASVGNNRAAREESEGELWRGAFSRPSP